MGHLNVRMVISILVATTILVWGIILLISGVKLTGSWDAITKLPQVVTIEVFLWFGFRRWFWRAKLFQGWLVPFPNLQGKWEGELKSTWINPETGEGVQPIRVEMSIVQDFSHICCSIRTGESTSKSYIANFNLDSESCTKYLIYSYANKPRAEVRNRSEMHNGTAYLEVLNNGTKLKGDYWTDRKTTGELELRKMENE